MSISDSEAYLLRSGLHKLNDGELIALCHLVGFTEHFFISKSKDDVITEVMEKIGRWSDL